MAFFVSKVLERFGVNPYDWGEIGDIATYDAVNKNIFVRSDVLATVDRYSKNHDELTDEDSFYMEHRIKDLNNKTKYAWAMCGCFNQAKDNFHDAFVISLEIKEVILTTFPTVWIRVFKTDGSHQYVQVTDNYQLPISSEYELKVKLWYDADSRVATCRVYKDDELIKTKQLALSAHTFSLDTFGVGNRHGVGGGYIYDVDLDDMYLFRQIDTVQEKASAGVTHKTSMFEVLVDNIDGEYTDEFKNFQHVRMEVGDEEVFVGRIRTVEPDDELGEMIRLKGRGYLADAQRRVIIEAYENKVASWIVKDLIAKYCPILSVDNVQTTTRLVTRTFKGIDALQAIDILAEEEDFDRWVNMNRDMNWTERQYESSGITIEEGVDDIINSKFPKVGDEVINRVTVYGDEIGGEQIVVMLEDLESQLFYGSQNEPVINEVKIIDKGIKTEADAEARAGAILNRQSWVVPVGEQWLVGFEDLQIGKTVELKYPSKGIDRIDVVLEKTHILPEDETYILTAMYVKKLEHAIGDLIKDLRQRGGESMDEHAITVRIDRFYEKFKVVETLKIYKITEGDSRIYGRIGSYGKYGRGGGVYGRKNTSSELVVDQ